VTLRAGQEPGGPAGTTNLTVDFGVYPTLDELPAPVVPPTTTPVVPAPTTAPPTGVLPATGAGGSTSGTLLAAFALLLLGLTMMIGPRRPRRSML
jgi:LPXTG-motif cell wall-anchored protein